MEVMEFVVTGEAVTGRNDPSTVDAIDGRSRVARRSDVLVSKLRQT